MKTDEVVSVLRATIVTIVMILCIAMDFKEMAISFTIYGVAYFAFQYESLLKKILEKLEQRGP